MATLAYRGPGAAGIRSVGPKDCEATCSYEGNRYSFRTIQSTRSGGVSKITPEWSSPGPCPATPRFDLE